MNNLFYNIEIITNNNPSLFINGLQILTLLFAILAVTNNNPVISILYLISTFITAAITFIFFNLAFVGYILIMVYVGAIAILFVFIVMLFQMENVDDNNENNFLTYPGLLLIATLPILYIAARNKNNNINGYNYFLEIKSITNNNLNTKFEKLNEVIFNNASEIATVGESLFATNPIYLFLIAILLLLGMIGAIHISLNR